MGLLLLFIQSFWIPLLPQQMFYLLHLWLCIFDSFEVSAVWLDYIIISFFYNLQKFFSIFILIEEYGNVPFQQKEVLDWDGFIMWHTLKLNVCPENRELDLLEAVLTNAAWLTSCALATNRIPEILLLSFRSVIYVKIAQWCGSDPICLREKKELCVKYWKHESIGKC